MTPSVALARKSITQFGGAAPGFSMRTVVFQRRRGSLGLRWVRNDCGIAGGGVYCPVVSIGKRWEVGLILGAVVLTLVVSSYHSYQRKHAEALADAQWIASYYNMGVAMAFTSLQEVNSEEEAIFELCQGSEASSCWGPDFWPPPEIPAHRIAKARQFLVFERKINPHSRPVETVPQLSVDDTRPKWWGFGG